MNCQRMEKSLIMYLDGKANPAERRSVEAHLAECAQCHQRVEQFQLLWGVLDEWTAPAPSADFDAGVRTCVAQLPARASFWAWLPSPRAAFALTAVVVL